MLLGHFYKCLQEDGNAIRNRSVCLLITHWHLQAWHVNTFCIQKDRLTGREVDLVVHTASAHVLAEYTVHTRAECVLGVVPLCHSNSNPWAGKSGPEEICALLYPLSAAACCLLQLSSPVSLHTY